MRVFSFFTGGKDSTAAYLRSCIDRVEPDLLVTVIPGRSDSYMFHTVNLRFTAYHALLLNNKILYYYVSGVKEREVEELRPLVSNLYESGYTVATAGGIASNYQRRRLEKLLNEYGIELYAPFWDIPQDEVLYRYLEMGIDFMLVSVSSNGLDRNALGWIIDGEDDVEEMITLGEKYGFNPTGEGGEYESFVLYTPRFWGYIRPSKYKIYWDGVSGYLELEKLSIERLTGDVKKLKSYSMGGVNG